MRPNLTIALFLYRFRCGWVWSEKGGWSKDDPPRWEKPLKEIERADLTKNVEEEGAWLAKLSEAERESYWRNTAAFILAENQIQDDQLRHGSLDSSKEKGIEPADLGYECGDPLQMSLVDLGDDLLTEIMGRTDPNGEIESDSKFSEYLDAKFFSALQFAHPNLADYLAARPDADGKCVIGGRTLEAFTADERAALTPALVRRVLQPLNVLGSTGPSQVEPPKTRTTLIRSLLLQGLTPTPIRNQLEERGMRVDLGLVKKVRRELSAYLTTMIERAESLINRKGKLLELVESKQFLEVASALKVDLERWLEQNSGSCRPEDIPAAFGLLIDDYEKSSAIDAFTASVMRELVESKQFARAIVLLQVRT
ncbi:MAG TPA: hypothetical protein VHZ24_01865 [Pirellulales bacterium]|jgi:hypothetical protein|nr:hypothetical protein [Pirellulales bacterium]